MRTANFIEHTDLKNNPFRVPHGYFDLLPQQIGQKIAQTSTRNALDVPLGLSFRRILSPQLAWAASFILMIGLGYGIARLTVSDPVDSELFSIDHISLFKTYTLLQCDELDDSLDSEDIIAFLTEHRISPNAIAFLD